jgi:hypothetical protein
MNLKWIAIVYFLITFSALTFGLNIKWLDKNRMEITNTKNNDDAKYWMDAMDNAMRDIFTRCLPKDWRNGVKNFYNSNRKITIMITDDNIDWREKQEEALSGKNECVCGMTDDNQGPIWLYFRPKQSDQTREGGCCNCPESTALHELIHAATGISGAYDDLIESCVYLALKKSGNCVNNLPVPVCDCQDHNGNKPHPDCKK